MDNTTPEPKSLLIEKQNKYSHNERQLEYYYKNKENMRKQQNKYKKTDRGRKNNRISRWRRSGLILQSDETYESIYKIVDECELCMNCGSEFSDKGLFRKCMDHDHETGFFRAVLCCRCNLWDPQYRKEISKIKCPKQKNPKNLMVANKDIIA